MEAERASIYRVDIRGVWGRENLFFFVSFLILHAYEYE
jgi:hypothetical protein